MRYSILAGAVALALGSGAPAAAATTVLDFSGNICGITGSTSCSNTSIVGQNYGDSAAINVSYRSIDSNTGNTFEAHLKVWDAGYGDLNRVVWGGSSPLNSLSEIVFAPAAGYEVALIGFDAACYSGRTTCRTLNYNIAGAGGDAIASGSTSTQYPGHVSLAVNSGYFTDGIVLRWGPDGFDVGLDNIAFDVRPIGGVGAVPEPATWAMLILGFGAVGAATRKRRAGQPVLA